MNFGTGGSPRYPVCQKNFILLLTDGEPCSDGKLPSGIWASRPGNRVSTAPGSNCPATSGTGWSFPASSLELPACGGTGSVTTHGDEAGSRTWPSSCTRRT